MTDDTAPTHNAFVKRYYTKKLYVWLEVGKGRQDKNGDFHSMLDRMPIRGFDGYTRYVRIGQEPPAPEPERPAEAPGGEDEG